MNPKITIITISYNNREGLEKTIKSVVSQSYSDFEYIIIDGGSKDGSKEVIEKFEDKISYWVSEPDKGIYNAMNKGIKAANGDYLLFLNSGDEFFEHDALKKSYPQLKNEDIVYGNLKVANGENSYIKEYPSKLFADYFIYESLPHPATFIKKKLFDKYGQYDENLKIVSDWKWFLEIITFKNITYKKIENTVSIFYLDGVSSIPSNASKVSIERNIVLEEHFPFVKKMLENEGSLKKIEYKYYQLTKYRIIRILAKLGIIKIL